MCTDQFLCLITLKSNTKLHGTDVELYNCFVKQNCCLHELFPIILLFSGTVV